MANAASLVSVAMATYNGERFIARQLESIINQTHTNIEIVITDDASADNTVAIIKNYQQQYPFIKLFVNPVNSGVTKTFEHSFRQCTGAFIAISDQDDIWELNKIEILLQQLGNEDAIYSNSALIDHNGASLHKEFKSLMNLQSYYDGAPFLMGNCVPGHTILMRADFLKNILPLPAEVMFDRWISFCAAANNGIKYVDMPLVQYRQHDNNTVGVGKSKNRKQRKTKAQQFEIKLGELKALEQAPVSNTHTQQVLKEMLALFHRKLSLKRSIFFFKNIDTLLVIKNKPRYRKNLYSLKMFFKPNY
ncbi:MAG: glycosyltransferase family 2 protein [Bacteroidetes bacterium]|nr:glycosyltransferase family 2 protein [Bacteroidota bacterium]